MIKRRRKKQSNQGNSFIVVVATLSFLAVLTTALLVAVALCSRLKAYDINSRDNFYYLEQAMDEIYEGMGKIAMGHLNDAYNETTDILVYYDPNENAYVTMDNDAASNLMKATFVTKLKKDGNLDAANIADTLNAMLSYPYDATNAPEGVQLSVGNVDASQSDSLIIKDVILKRKASYSTVNTNSQAAAATYVQSITTDLVIKQPDFEVNFDLVDNENNDLYDFVLIGDMGVEINGIMTNSSIYGNVYAAADFYNKEYNKDKSTDVQEENENTRKEALQKKVCSYTDEQLENCDGVSEKSMYSGFYVSGAKVSILADKLIIPGSVASMNCGKLTIGGGVGSADPAKVWADGIALGGYSRKQLNSESLTGSVLKMAADAYVYDDLEVNATGSDFSLDGNYFGYNYASEDNRKFVDGVKLNVGADGSGMTGQAHYNSSAIIVNGEESRLDLSMTKSIYVAGQAYVELSKSAESKTYYVTEDENEEDGLKWEEVPEDAENAEDDGREQVTKDTYQYVDQDDDNYTQQSDGEKTRIQDYRTGEGVSVKSNQLAYMSMTTPHPDANGNLCVTLPGLLRSNDYFNNIWPDPDNIPIVTTVISGKEYHFFDFSKAKEGFSMNQYMEEYAKLFDQEGEDRSIGEQAGLFDITDYEAFTVDEVLIDASRIYSNSAISAKDGSKITIVADGSATDALLEANKALDGNPKKQEDTVGESAVYARGVTVGLQTQYKEMKMLLTDASGNGDAVTNAYAAEESEITPINYYFNYNALTNAYLNFNNLGRNTRRTVENDGNGRASWKYDMESGYQLLLGEGDVEIKADDADGKVMGVVLCKGDVTFNPNVKEFEGLIVAGGKVLVNHSIDFLANPEIVKSILKECDESRFSTAVDDISVVCKLFRHYDLMTQPAGPDPEEIVSMKSVSAVLYEDILAFGNWKKNVD